MPNPAFQKTWDFTGLNQRISFTSLLDTSSRLLYGIKNYLVGTMGAALVFSCDGTTGPSSQVDATDRWASFSDCDTRSSVSGAAQSSAVIAWGGGQLLLAFNGASDDIFRVAFSPGSLFRASSAPASFTFTAAVTDICTAVAHGQVTGNGPFFLTVGGAAPSPVVINTPYWIHRLTNDTFYLCSTYANALAGVPIDIGTTGTPPNTLTCLATTAPIAADEVQICTGISIIASTASLDRVFAIEATTDRSIFRIWIHRSGVLTESFGLERISEGYNIPVGTLVAWNSNGTTANAYTTATSGSHAGAMTGALGQLNSMTCSVFGASRVCAGGVMTFDGVVSQPAGATILPLNAAAPIWPITIAHTTAATAGFIGTRIDAFFHHSTLATALLAGTACDDLAAGTRLMWCGTMLTPWSPSVGLVRT